MKESIFYSRKFPKISELIPELNTNLNFKYFIIFVILLIFVCILLNNLLLDKLLFILIMLLFLIIHFRISFVRKMLIKRIEQVFEENSALSKKTQLSVDLLQGDMDFNAQKKKVRYFGFALICVLILPFILLRIISIDMWLYLFTVITLIILVNLQYIFECLRKLMESCYQKVIDNKDFSESFLKKDSINLDWKHYETKWKKLLIFLIFIALFYIFLLDFRRTVYLLLIDLIILGLIILDVNKIAEKCLTVLGSYDEYIKSKLGMEFKSSKKQTVFPIAFFDEEEMEQKNKKIKDLMNRNVKDFFK